MIESSKRNKRIKSNILDGKTIEIHSEYDIVRVWFHKKWGFNQFILEVNEKIIKSTKTFNPIAKKLNEIL